MEHRWKLTPIFLWLLVSCGTSSEAVREDALPPLCSLDSGEAGAELAVARDHRPTLIVNAVVMTAAGDVFENGHIYFEEGRIAAVGEAWMDPPADDVWVIDAEGRHVTPGLIDTHSHLGVYPEPNVQAHSDGNEATNPVTAHVQAIHSVWPQDPGFMRAMAGGVTTLQILPGSANLIGGRGITIKIHRGARTPEDLRFPAALEGLKMACGENPKHVYGARQSAPSTRMGNIAMMRQAWLQAQRYRERWDEYDEDLHTWCEEGAPEDEEPDVPERDLGMETLALVLEGEILPHVHCYRADEMLVQIQIADEFGFQIRSFEHAVEAYKIRDVLAEREIGSNVWADWWGFKLEAFDSIEENAGLLAEAGARASIHSDSSVWIQRLNQEAAKAFYTALDAGVDVTEDDALAWITLDAAWILGVHEQTGSLEVGKMADVVSWSSQPLSVYASADMVFVDGVLEYDRATDGEPWSDFELGLWPQECSDE